MLTADFPPSPWSGVGIAVQRRAEALCRMGAEVDVLVSNDLSPVGAEEPGPGAPRVMALPRDHFPVDPKRYDWIHVHSLRLAPLALELRRRTRRPLVATVHGMPHLELGATPLARRWAACQSRLLRACDRVVFLSRAEARAGRAWLPEITSRSRIVPHGTPVPSSLGMAFGTAERPADGPVVFAGRLTASKGIDRVGELAAKSRASWVVAGGRRDPAGAAALRRLAANPRCRLPGWLPRRRLDELLRRARLVIVPSRYEPFGLLALEAMAQGAPVLAADVGGLRDTVRQRSGGRRCRSDDTREWARTLQDLLESGEATELGRRGPGWVATHFDPDRRAAELLQQVYGASSTTHRLRPMEAHLG